MTRAKQLAVDAGLSSVDDHDYSLKRPFEQVVVQVTNEFPYQEEHQREEEEHIHKRVKKANMDANADSNPTFAPAAVATADQKVRNEQWEATFARLIQYKRIHGDCLVPYRYAQDLKLAYWVRTQVSMWTRETCASIPC